MIAGLVIGATAWSATRSLPYAIESGALGAWSAGLADLDSSYEAAGDHAWYPLPCHLVPFGRSIADRLQSLTHAKLLHSLAAIAGFTLLGEALAWLPGSSYARMQLIVATWVIFAFLLYAMRTFLRTALWRSMRGPALVMAGSAYALWETWFGHLPYLRTLPPEWFIVAWGGGFAGSAALEILSSRGVPLLWPLGWRIRLPLAGDTGGIREMAIMVAFIAYALGWWLNHYPSFHKVVVIWGVIAVTLAHSLGMFLDRWL